MKIKSVEQLRHPVYDVPTKYGTYGIWNPPVFDVAGFQKKLDAIAGTSLGKPIVRLVWAWDKRCRDPYFTEWDIAGNGTKLEFGYKYRVARVPIGNGDTVDICPPRWILEERFEPGQYTPSWEATRWAEQDIGKRHTCNKTDAQRSVEMCDCLDIRQRIELKPPAPGDGWYNLHRVIAEHEPNQACCERLFKEGRQNCWGLYRLPAQKDLDRLQRAISLRDADDHKVDPHQPMSEEALKHAHRAAFAEMEAEEAAKQSEKDDLAYASKDWAERMIRNGFNPLLLNSSPQSNGGLILPWRR